MKKPATCFHCGDALPAVDIRCAIVDGQERAFCCAGCAMAAEFIRDAGLARYYAAAPAGAKPGESVVDLSTFDSEAAMSAAIRRDGDRAEVTLVLEGIRCGACAWLIEQVVAQVEGCVSARANAVTARVTIAWKPARVALSALLAPLVRLGYRPHLPGANDDADAAARRRQRTSIKRIAVAGIGMMQAMMFAEALYFGADMDSATRDFFRWIGLLCATPVVAYSGWPFLRGAWQEFKALRPGMDALVATTVSIAYIASLVETLRGGPVVYYDAAVMFVFLLLVSREVEGAALRRARHALDVLARAQPAVAYRLVGDALVEVPPQELVAGDRIRVRNGDALPADGTLVSPGAELDESVLTGESLPVAKRSGDAVLAGSICRSAPIDVDVTRAGAGTTLANAMRMAERAATERPRSARIADQVASRFVVALFGVTTLVALAWWFVDPAMVLPVSLAVLAVTCPCALSIAVPATLAAAQSRLARDGVLVARADAVDRLATIDAVMFDKTGTLTDGRPRLASIESMRPDALAIAAALERDCVHPIADAFRRAAVADAANRNELSVGSGGALPAASHIVVEAGGGVSGLVDGVRYRLGAPAWIGTDDDGAIVLADDHGVVARFRFGDTIRSDAQRAVDALTGRDIAVLLCSGDGDAAVRATALQCGVESWDARVSPAGKLERLQAWRGAGRRVAMVGDGINDAAVLAGADVSIAMGTGAALAQAQADLVLMTGRLAAIAPAIDVARRARRIIRQNLAWSIAYNALALPVAALGYAPPWLAAVGMCASSLGVTLNAMRVLRAPRPTPRAAVPLEATA